MTKKELSQLYYLKKEIKQQQRRIAELETVATNCSTKITGLPSGKGISDKIGNYAAQIADLKALLDLNLKKCFYELNRLDRFIQSVEDPLLRQILTCRFVNGYSWRNDHVPLEAMNIELSRWNQSAGYNHGTHL